MEPTVRQKTLTEADAGQRIDRLVADWLASFSRATIQTWIRDGAITVDGQTVAPRYRVKGHEEVVADLPAVEIIDEVAKAQDIPLELVYEDEQIFVINKPAGLVMHTAPGNYSGTLENGLLHLDAQLSQIPRAGIVHRLDKDTSGVVMVARTLESHFSLVNQLQERTVHRVYDAIVQGEMVAGGIVDEPIGRHPVDRKRMAVNEAGKNAVTHYRVTNKYERHCHISVKLETGRTHQIRVHMSHIQHPLVGDRVYGRRNLPSGVSDSLKETIVQFPRQALHARELGIIHPGSGDEMMWESALPDDMQKLLNALANG